MNVESTSVMASVSSWKRVARLARAVAVLLLLSGASTGAFSQSGTDCSGEGLNFAGGLGTSSSPYRIATLCQLQSIASTPDYIQVAHIDASPTRSWNVYTPGSTAKGFVPLGATYSSTGVRTEEDLGFSGVFDGGGYRISNLFINRLDEDRVGLFSQLSGGTLRRVLLENTQTTGRNFVGSLAGVSERGLVTDSYAIEGIVSGEDYVGGFVGRNKSASIRNSHADMVVMGTDRVGGLVGWGGSLQLGTVCSILNSYATGPIMGSGQRVGGLIGSSTACSIKNSYAAGNATGHSYVGGFVGLNFRSSISSSYATGNVTGINGTGGLVGETFSTGSISNCYATGKVAGTLWAGGLVGKISSGGSIHNSYATGKVTGASIIGDLIGIIDSGPIVLSNSYSNSTASITGGTVGSSAIDIDAGNFSRTLVQLRCPTGLGQPCGSPPVQTYSGWSTGIWYFGDAQTLPRIRHTSVPGTPLQLEAQWLSPSTLRLSWVPPELGNVNIEYQVKAPGISSVTRSTFFDVSGADLEQLRKKEGGSNFEFSVQGSNHFGEKPGPTAMTEVLLLNVPGVPGMLAVTENDLLVSVAFDPPDNDGFGRNPRDRDFGKAAEGTELELGYLVELYRGRALTAERSTRSALSGTSRITVDFPEPIELGVEYRIVVRFYNTGGDSPTVESILLRYCSGNDLVPDGGSGISSSPYRVATLCQLQGMASTPHYIQVADIDASPTRSWNVYPEGSAAKGFAPLGTSYSSTGVRTGDLGFSGVFDGGGYRISNLFINRPGEDRVGLFSQLSAGTLRRVLLEDSGTSGKDSVGSLVGVNETGVIRNSRVVGEVSGRNHVGGLAGGNFNAKPRPTGREGIITGSSMVGMVIGSGDNVGGLVGNNGPVASITNCYAGSTVTGNVNVGGVVGNTTGLVNYSYATGSITGKENVGGLMGRNGDRVSNVYATGTVSGSTNVGGIAGSNHFYVETAYATGMVNGSTRVGGIAGLNASSGFVLESYATTRILGLNLAPDAMTPEHTAAVRTLEQLRCPLGPEATCGGEHILTYAATYWKTNIWYFGDRQTLPRIRHTSVPGTPLQLEAQWLSPSTLRLSWDAPELGNVNIEYQVKVPGISSVTRSTFFDVSGADLEQLRKKEGGSNFEFSVQGSNHFSEGPGPTAMTEVLLLNVPGVPGMLAVTENDLLVSVAFDPPDNDGFGRNPRDRDFGTAAEGTELELGYLVELYRGRALTAVQSTRSALSGTSRITVDFPEPIELGVEYRIVVRFYNAGGDSPTVGSILLRYCPENDLVPDGGSGTSSSPYRIATLCQLQGMASTPHYIQVDYIDASPTRSWNVYPEGSAAKGFAPLGASYSSTGVRTGDLGFSGVFDGGGYRISNLFINRPGEDRVGLFSQLLAGTLRRVLLEDTQTTGRNRVGSLTGAGDQGLVTDSYAIEGRVSGKNNVGGLAGNLFGGNTRNSYATGNVTGNTNVGGLAGSFFGSKGRNNYATGNVTGNINVGGLAGSMVFGDYDGNYATGNVTGEQFVGGLAGVNTSANISSNYATGNVTAIVGAGGLVGEINSDGNISSSYATGNVSGTGGAGGLVGRINSGGSISNSYATGNVRRTVGTGNVSGTEGAGGLVGEINSGGSISNSYATGKVTGTGSVGDLIGFIRAGPIVISNSYSNSTASTTGGTVGSSEVEIDAENSSRTLVQLRCPTGSGQPCGSPPVQTYSGWSTDIWYFGDAQTLPRIRHTSVPSTPLRLEAKWLSPSTLRLSWDAPELGNVNIEYQVKAPGISSMTRSTFFYVSGTDLEQLRKREGAGGLEFSVQGSNHFGEEPGSVAMTEVPLLNVPGPPPGRLAVTENDLFVSVAFDPPDNDGFGRNPRDPDFGEAADGIELELGYLVELYRGKASTAVQSTLSGTSRITVDFPEPIELGVEYRIVVRFYNVVDDGPTMESILLRYCSGNDLVPDGGSGISSSPYRVATLCQLQGMASTPHYIQVAHIDASPTRSWNVYPEGSTAKGFAPVGATYSSTGVRTGELGFSGVFDGGGYRISNLFINRPGEDRVGLFSRLSEGTLRRVLLEDTQTTGRDSVGSLTGVSSRGLVTDSYAIVGRVSGSTRVGGLVGSNEESTIRRSYATVTVLGSVGVGGLVGLGEAPQFNTACSILSSYAAGSITGSGRNVGGLAGAFVNCNVKNNYATGNVTGNGNVGGFAGSNSGGSIDNGYATGKVTGSSEVGGFVGRNSGTIRNSYGNSTATSTGELVGSNEAGTVIESDSRTLVQLRCPSEPGQECGSPPVQTYSGWSTGIWYFGDAEALPVIIRTLPAPGTPVRLEAQWPSPSTLRLLWDAPRFGSVNVEYQVKVAVLDISEKTRSTFLDVSGADLEQLRKKEGGSSFEFSVQGSNHFGEVTGPTAMTEAPLLNVPGPPSSLEMVTTEVAEGELQASVTFGPTNNDGLGRDSGNPDFGEAVGGLELQLAYFVEIYAGRTMSDTRRIVLQASDASTTILFPGLAPNLDYRVIVRAENVVGFSSPVDRLFGSSPSITISGDQVENSVYGASSLKHTLRASAPYASSLRWGLLTAPEKNNSTVYFTTDTGSEAVLVYESLDEFGIVLSDRFTVRVTGPTGSDTIEVNVKTASATPVIVQGELTTARISRGVVSTEVALNTRNIHEDLTWSWVDGQSMTTARFRAQDGVEAEMGESSQNMTVVLYVPEELNETSFTIKVIEAGDSELRDEIVIRVVRQRMAGARLRFRVFLGGAVR